MKYLILTFLLFSVFTEICAQNTTVYKKAIIDYVQIRNGIKTDLGIQVSNLEEKNITVADSIEILTQQYLKEKATKVRTAEKSIAHYEAQISKQKSKGGLVAEAMIESLIPKLKKAQQELKEAKEWNPDYLQRYKDQDPHAILSKLVSCRLSLMNPKLNARQEGDASFIFSADGQKLVKSINR